MTEMQYVFFFFFHMINRATDEFNNHNVGFYCQFPRSRGDGISGFVSVST